MMKNMMNQIVTEKKKTRPPVARNKCEDFGIEKICDLIISGDSMTNIAAQIGVNISTLIEWSEGDTNRSARVREARRHSGRIWDEKAEECIRLADDKFGLDKAKELAHHYRWRAKAIAPREYGDKVTQEHTGAGGGPIAIAAVDLKNLSDDELENMNLLMAKAVKKD